MKPLRHVVAPGICIAFISLAWSVLAAYDSASQDTAVQKALARDAVCTACHNENWRVPVLTLYQTRHGNRADPRSPNCQSCHGESSAHQKDPVGARPDVVFGAKSRTCRRQRTKRRLSQVSRVRILPRTIGPAASIKRAAWPAPIAMTSTPPPRGCSTRSLSPTSALNATRPSVRRFIASRPTRSWPARWRAPIATTRTARPGRRCSSRTRSTRPATHAMRRNAGRSSGSTPRLSMTAPTATRRTARICGRY